MNNPRSRLLQSRSFDPNMTFPMPRLYGIQNKQNNAFDLSSLQMNMRNVERQDYRNTNDVTMLSPVSDRSIEPMSVSDVSERDLDDVLSLNDFSQHEHMEKPSGQCNTSWFCSMDKNSIHNDDSMSLFSNRTSNNNYNGSKSIYSTSTYENVEQTDKLSSDSEVSDTTSIHSVRPKSMKSHGDVTTIEKSTVKKSFWRKACTFCIRIFQFSVMIAITAIIVKFSSKEIQSAICDRSLLYNVSALEVDLNENVFGQQIAISHVIKAIDALMKRNDKNITVLSFHGWTGIGKNYISSYIAKRVDDSYIHKIIIPLAFAHSSNEHRELMFQRLTGSVLACAVNVFIIDEVDKASTEMIKGLQEALRNITQSELEKTKIIVLLLSNSGGSAINRYYLDQLSDGRNRKDITHGEVIEFMLTISEAQINHEWHVPLYKDGTIDDIVPFLPLEKSHVAKCADRYISLTRPQLGFSDRRDIVKRVLEQMSFFPQGLELFSTTGCRGVAFKVDLTVD